MKNNFNQKKIDRHLDYINDKIAQYEYELNEAEDLESIADLQDKIATQKARKVEYKSIERQLQDSNQTQISTVDPDAKAVVLHRNIVNVGYNVQAVCDAKHKLFTNAQTGSVNDTHALADMAIETKELLGLDKLNTLTDKGYTTGAEIAQCTKHNITTYSSPKEHSSQKNGLYDMQEFEYNETADTYTCPAQQTLITNRNYYKKRNHQVKHYKNKKAYQDCPLRHQCTTNKNGQIIERSKYQKDLEDNQKRVEQNPDYYRLRQQVTEHQFGTLKRQWGFTYTLLKRKENVLSEIYINFSAYNLLRLMKILCPQDIIKRLKSLCLHFLEKIDAFLVYLSHFFISKYKASI